MTQEQKAKAYDEALERANASYKDEDRHLKATLERIFPELSESEDEKIRKELIEHIKANKEVDYVLFKKFSPDNVIAWLEKLEVFTKYGDGLYYFGNNGFTYIGNLTQDNISWLAKQCEQKLPIENEEDYNSIDPHFGKPINKVEPKFKVGDWITNGQLTCKVLGITSKSYELHLYNDDYCHFETDIQSVDKDYHLWSIKDARNGDVLTSISFHSNCTFIFKGLDNWKFDEPNGDRVVATGYCCLSASADKMEFGIQGPDCVEVNTVKPATKIQRDLLFLKMREAGYEWNADKKELKKIGQNQKSAWSEEDMFKVQRICTYLDEAKKYYADITEVRDCIDWLKSLKERIQR